MLFLTWEHADDFCLRIILAHDFVARVLQVRLLAIKGQYAVGARGELLELELPIRGNPSFAELSAAIGHGHEINITRGLARRVEYRSPNLRASCALDRAFHLSAVVAHRDFNRRR